jgi:hypothetical protein
MNVGLVLLCRAAVTGDRAMTRVTPVHDNSGGSASYAIQWLFRGESVVVTDAAAPSREQADISAITPRKQGRTNR